MIAFLLTLAAPNPVRISCSALPDVHKMCAVGDFNHWDAPGKEMQLSKDGATWSLSLSLDYGVYRYVLLKNAATIPTGDEFQKQVKFLVLTLPSTRSTRPLRAMD
jgi:hypothetical protein